MTPEIDGDRGTACFTFIWALETYSELPYFSLTSPWFSGGILENTRWHLWLQDEEDVNLPVACYIFRGSDEETKGSIDVSFELAILGSDGMPLVTKSGEKCFEEFSQSEWVELVDKNSILGQKEIFLPNDILTIRCQLRVKKSLISAKDICFARTVLGVEKREFFWTNEEFSHIRPGQKRSVLVQPLQKGVPIIELTLYLQGPGNEEDIILEMNLQECHGIHATLAKISVVDAYGSIAHSNDKGNLLVARPDCPFSNKGIEIPLLLKNKSRSLHNDTLFLLCEMKTSFGVVLSRLENCGNGLNPSVKKEASYSLTSFNSDSSGDAEKANEESFYSCNSDSLEDAKAGDNSIFCCSFCPLKRALVRRVKSGSHPDVCLTNLYKSFYVHKDILENKSPKFKNLVWGNMTNKRLVVYTNYIHALVTYIYTGIVGDIDRDFALDMLEAAKKYGLPDLQQACSEFLGSTDIQQEYPEFPSSGNEETDMTSHGRYKDRKLKRRLKRVRHVILDVITNAFF